MSDLMILSDHEAALINGGSIFIGNRLSSTSQRAYLRQGNASRQTTIVSGGAGIAGNINAQGNIGGNTQVIVKL